MHLPPQPRQKTRKRLRRCRTAMVSWLSNYRRQTTPALALLFRYISGYSCGHLRTANRLRVYWLSLLGKQEARTRRTYISSDNSSRRRLVQDGKLRKHVPRGQADFYARREPPKAAPPGGGLGRGGCLGFPIIALPFHKRQAKQPLTLPGATEAALDVKTERYPLRTSPITARR